MAGLPEQRSDYCRMWLGPHDVQSGYLIQIGSHHPPWVDNELHTTPNDWHEAEFLVAPRQKEAPSPSGKGAWYRLLKIQPTIRGS
jgi:hypothetical protein